MWAIPVNGMVLCVGGYCENVRSCVCGVIVCVTVLLGVLQVLGYGVL